MKCGCQNSFSVVIVESEWVINTENTRRWSLVWRKRGCFFEAKPKGPVKMLLLVVSWKSWWCYSVGRDDVESALPNKHWTGRNQPGPLAFELGLCTGLSGTVGLGELPSPSGPIPCAPPPNTVPFLRPQSSGDRRFYFIWSWQICLRLASFGQSSHFVVFLVPSFKGRV